MASTTPISYSQLDSSSQNSLQASKTKRSIFIPLARYLKAAWREALADVSTRWPIFFLTLWLGGLFIIIIIITVFLPPPSSACRPDDTFSPFDGYSYWDISGFFQVTLPLGTFTFTQAKVIDIVWDIVIGRAGQGILAYCSWRTFADYATVSMETAPITYTSFIILFMESGPSVKSMFQLLRDFLAYRRLKSKVAAAWIVLSMLFVLAWPTLIAALSGYSPNTGAYVKDVNGSFVPYNEFRLLSYIIHDGQRINLTDDYPIPFGPVPDFPSDNILLSEPDYTTTRYSYPGYSSSECYFTSSEEDRTYCYLQANVSDYILKYGFNGRSRTASQWLNYTLPSNSLDVEPSILSPSVLSSLNMTQGFQPIWTYENHIYTLQDIRINGACQALGAEFQWGFSYLQLFIIVILLIIWTSGTCLLRHRAHQFLPLEGQPERPRGFRALLLLAEAIQIELQTSGIDPHSLKNNQLKHQIYKCLKGGSTSFGFPLRRKTIRRRTALQWMKEDLWLLVIVTATGVPLSLFLGPVFIPISLGILSTFFIGTTAKSRFLLFTLSIIIALLIVLPIVFELVSPR
ncbi:hypothetical protein F5Y07DRAFT_371738 [Xylaria sp. FL0933]|nr:hypothetical protein F5Y07DRAFT_371738 [Xylaria sp. FL0933]